MRATLSELYGLLICSASSKSRLLFGTALTLFCPENKHTDVFTGVLQPSYILIEDSGLKINEEKNPMYSQLSWKITAIDRMSHPSAGIFPGLWEPGLVHQGRPRGKRRAPPRACLPPAVAQPTFPPPCAPLSLPLSLFLSLPAFFSESVMCLITSKLSAYRTGVPWNFYNIKIFSCSHYFFVNHCNFKSVGPPELTRKWHLGVFLCITIFNVYGHGDYIISLVLDEWVAPTVLICTFLISTLHLRAEVSPLPSCIAMEVVEGLYRGGW